jgi:hypothetical protein
MKPQDFISQLSPLVVTSWKSKNVIIPSVAIAQAAFESNYDNGTVALQVNNLFGILANGWAASQCFLRNGILYRKYNNWAESVQDHSNFLVENKRYSNLIGVTDYKAVSNFLQSDGYPGNLSTYASSLISIVERYELMIYDVAPQVPPASSGAAPAFPGASYFGKGKANQYILLLGQQLVKKGYGKHYKVGPSKTWGEADRLNCQDFQLAQGWKGSGANGIPGPFTWKLLFE